jgi:pimeloyl-ACP methyl ester carboxylesterase
METEARHLSVRANGINMHVVEQGVGPLVLLCHGFPETWRCWRHQIPAAAAAGYRIAAPDLRGYGRTDAPAEIESYTIMHLVGDLVGLVRALGEKQAVIVGHDWGASVAWMASLIRPDVFKAVAALSVPYRPRGPAAPLGSWRAAGLGNFYFFYFQEPGVAEAEFESDVRGALRRGLYTLSGDAPPTSEWSPLLTPGCGFLNKAIDPERLPSWITERDIELVATEFERTGFRGALNWYRNIDRNWALTAAFQGRQIDQPALFIAGTRDISLAGPGKVALDELPSTVPGLTRKVLIDGAGHWIGEERPTEVNAALVDFLDEFARPFLERSKTRS